MTASPESSSLGYVIVYCAVSVGDLYPGHADGLCARVEMNVVFPLLLVRGSSTRRRKRQERLGGQILQMFEESIQIYVRFFGLPLVVFPGAFCAWTDDISSNWACSVLRSRKVPGRAACANPCSCAACT